jgi:hypothetical protein
MQAQLSSPLAKVSTQVHAYSRFQFLFLCFHPSTDVPNLAGCDLARRFAPRPDLIGFGLLLAQAARFALIYWIYLLGGNSHHRLYYL